MLLIPTVVLSLLLLVVSPAYADAKRVALVIGNAAYQVGPLANPVNDAEAVAGALRGLGFDKVSTVLNATKTSMAQALATLADDAVGSEIALVYFAGHGTEREGRNYLIPVDARLARGSDLDLQAINLATVLDQISGASKLKLVILDACRNNIFPLAGSKRSTPRGLARVEPEDNSLIVYAAKDGTTADDGTTSRHSPFTAALLKHIVAPGIEIDYMFRLVRDDVMAATNRQQQPHIYGTLGRERLYLASAALITAPMPPLPVARLSIIPPTVPDSPANKRNSSSMYSLEWEKTYPIQGTDADLYGIAPIGEEFVLQAQSKLPKFDSYCSSVARAKADGTMEWTSRPSNAHCDGSLDLIPLSGGDTLVFGQRSLRNLKSLSAVMRLTSTGQLRWQTLLTDVTKWYAFKIIDNRYLVIGEKEIGGSVGWLRTIDPNGQLGREILVGSPNLHRNFRGGALLISGEILLGGTTAEGTDWRGWLVKFDQNLNVTWQKTLTEAKSGINRIYRSGSGALALAYTGGKHFLLKVEDSGQISRGADFPEGMSSGHCFRMTENECHLAMWTFTPESSTAILKLGVVGDDGQLEVHQTITLDDWRKPQSVAELASGDLIVSGAKGRETSGSKKMGWIARFKKVQ